MCRAILGKQILVLTVLKETVLKRTIQTLLLGRKRFCLQCLEVWYMERRLSEARYKIV